MIIAIAYPMIIWEAGMMVKFVVLTVLSFAATVSIYLLLIRPFDVMRFLFGMKPKGAKLKDAHARAVRPHIAAEESIGSERVPAGLDA